MLLLLFVSQGAVPTLSSEYLELVTSVAPDFAVLVEVQLMEPLGAWTPAGGGLTNTYYCQFSTQIATDVSGGLYRHLDFVRQNASPLTEQGSSAAVNANLGSYWHDTATARLYVSTTTGAHPDTLALIGAWFTLCFSTCPVHFSDQTMYAPLVTGALPTLTAEMPDQLFGAMVSDSGTVSFLNGDGLFDKLSDRYVWRNKVATFKLGGVSLDYADFATIETMRINGIDVDDEVATLTLEDAGSVLNKSLPLKTWGDGTITGWSFPSHAELTGILGQSQPLVFGYAVACPLALGSRVEGVSDTWYAYDFNSGPYGFCFIDPVWAYNRTEKTGARLTLGVDYIISGASVVVTNATYFYETHDIIANLLQLGTSASPRFGTMARAILEICGVDSSQLDTAAFSQADLDAPQILSRYVVEPIQAADLMRELERSVNGQVYRDAFGRWTCRVLTPSTPEPTLSLLERDFSSWAPEGDLTTQLNEVRVRHSHRPFQDEWIEESSSSDTVRYASETSDSHRIDTWLTTEADAAALAGHLRFLNSEQSRTIQVEERGLSMMTARVGDLVTVTRGRAPVARTGRYDAHYLRIVKIEKGLGPDVPTVRAWLNDLGGQTDHVFRLAPSGYAFTWDTAPMEDKALYGFLSDANGYIDSTDPSTRFAKVLW